VTTVTIFVAVDYDASEIVGIPPPSGLEVGAESQQSTYEAMNEACQESQPCWWLLMALQLFYGSRSLLQSQGGHSAGKPGKVREFQSGQGKVRENGKSQGKIRETEVCFIYYLEL